MSRTALHRGATAALAGLLAFAFAVVGSGHDASAANASVNISGFAFVPASVTVSVGDTVTWTNSDTAPHTATSDTAGVFGSPTLNQGGTFSHTFTTAGTFAYHCNIHPSMTGTVVVTGAAATATTAAPTATSTAGAATSTPTAAATATTAAPTATNTTAAATATPTRQATSPAGSPTAAGTTAPQPPATGDSGGDDGGNGLLIAAGIGAVALAAVAGAVVLKRRAA